MHSIYIGRQNWEPDVTSQVEVEVVHYCQYDFLRQQDQTKTRLIAFTAQSHRIPNPWLPRLL